MPVDGPVEPAGHGISEVDRTHEVCPLERRTSQVGLQRDHVHQAGVLEGRRSEPGPVVGSPACSQLRHRNTSTQARRFPGRASNSIGWCGRPMGVRPDSSRASRGSGLRGDLRRRRPGRRALPSAWAAVLRGRCGCARATAGRRQRVGLVGMGRPSTWTRSGAGPSRRWSTPCRRCASTRGWSRGCSGWPASSRSTSGSTVSSCSRSTGRGRRAERARGGSRAADGAARRTCLTWC
jgi:hypothetical protein